MAYNYLNKDGVAYLWEKIKGKFVQKETGKGLSTNDYTTEEKTKLAGIEAKAQVNVLEGIQVAGGTITPTNKIANVPAVQGATASAAGKAGVAPAPATGQQNYYLAGDGTWHSTATTAQIGLMSADDKSKLNNIAAGAEVNQNAFSTIKVGTTTVTAETATDTLNLTGRGSVSITANASTDTITISGTNTTYSVATTAANGLMSSSDKSRLNNIVVFDRIVIQNADSTTTSSVLADQIHDQLNLRGEGSITLSASDTYDRITISGTDTTYAASTSAPLMSGTAAVGTSASYARADHVHPTDTSRAPLASPHFTGTPTAPTATAGTATTQIATTAFVSTAITNALADITGIEYEVVQSLPASGSKGVIYLLANNGTAPNIYDEYIWTGTAFEKIGTTDVDLSGYVQKTDMVAITNAEIDMICV